MRLVMAAMGLMAMGVLAIGAGCGEPEPTDEASDATSQAAEAYKCTVTYKPRAPKAGDRVAIYLPGSDGKPPVEDVFKPWPKDLVVAVANCPFPGYQNDDQFQKDTAKACAALSTAIDTNVGTKPARPVIIVGASWGGILASCLGTKPPAGIKPISVVEYGGSVPNCGWDNPTCKPYACLLVGKDDDIHNPDLQKQCLPAFGAGSKVMVCPGGHAPSKEGLCTFQQVVADAGASLKLPAKP